VHQGKLAPYSQYNTGMNTAKPPSLKYLDLFAKLMDSQFRIPGTNIRFGLDPLIGLIPGVGDFAGFVVSAFMLNILVKNGASGFVLARMVFNCILDAVLGSIPVVGDIFDVGFKANQRNLQLLREHYVEGRHNGSAWKLIIPLLFILSICIAGITWLGYKLVVKLIS
jgi:hypothetical protein